MSWLRSCLTDRDGSYDIAYVSMFGVCITVLGAIPFMCIMAGVSYWHCIPVYQESGSVVQCVFDPQPLGFAIGAVAGGFATALGALAAYMLATRRTPVSPPAPPPQSTNVQVNA
jgi:hypothetical protein